MAAVFPEASGTSYSQSPQSQQTPECPRLHRTYQIAPQVPGGVRKVKVRQLLSVPTHFKDNKTSPMAPVKPKGA